MKRQWTVGSSIEIGPSRLLRALLLLLWGGGALAIALLSPHWVWIVQGLWAAAVCYWAASSYGIARRQLVLTAARDGWQVSLDGGPEPLVGIRGGLIGPRMATAVLRTPHASHVLVATGDNTSAEEHRLLRRLLVDGIPREDQASLGRGT